MSLRIACSTHGTYTSFVISKILFRKFDSGRIYSERKREISAIAGVSERTIYKRMTEYDLKIRDFSKVSYNQLDQDVLALSNGYPFSGKIMLREILKGRGFTIWRFRLRDSIHRVNDFGVLARKKGGLGEGFIMLEVQITYDI